MRASNDNTRNNMQHHQPALGPPAHGTRTALSPTLNTSIITVGGITSITLTTWALISFDDDDVADGGGAADGVFLLVAAPVTVVLGSASGRRRAATGRRASAVRRVMGVSGGLGLLRWW